MGGSLTDKNMAMVFNIAVVVPDMRATSKMASAMGLVSSTSPTT